MRIDEIDHEYRGTELGMLPLKKGDRVKLYHGFRDFPHAVDAAKDGISGAMRADRVYSYESDNNPKGLFATMNFKIASEFVGSYGPQVVMEFMASVDELEAPAWPSGSYTVQGQMAQYFGRGAKGRAKRRQVQKSDEIDTREMAAKDDVYRSILDSDYAHLAYLLFFTREAQALFVGHLNPGDITAFHVRDDHRGDWRRIGVEEFLTQYGGEAKASEKLFGPRDEFDGDLFLERLMREMGWRDDDILPEVWRDIKEGPNRTHRFVETFGAFLWPKQYAGAVNWLRRRYR